MSDIVLDGEGQPVVGATVCLLRASDFTTPPVVDPGSGFYVSSTVSSLGGVFSFDHIAYDDYHIMVKYSGLTTFRYFVPALPVEVADTKSDQGRRLVQRTLSQMLSSANVTMAFVGDGLTVGYNAAGTTAGSFVNKLGVLIGAQITPTAQVQRYDPNAYGSLQDGPIAGWTGPTTIQSPSQGSNQVISMANLGVSGDTVQRVLRRWSNLTAGSSLPIDCIFVQLGINDSLTTDATKFVPPSVFHSGLLGLVDAIRSYIPQAEVVLLTPHQNNQPDAGNGGSIPANTYTLEEYALAVRRVAIEQGCALVDLRQLWADAYNSADPNIAGNDGYGTWLNNAGSNHTNPTDAGHQAIADECFKIFGTPGAAPGRAMRFQSLGTRNRYKNLETIRLPNQHPALQFAGGHWATYSPSALASLYYSGQLEVSSTAGDTLTVIDRMQDFSILLRRNTDGGQFTVAVDGGAPVTFDTYRAYPASISDTSADGATYPLERQQVVAGLSDAEHTVVITVTGAHDAGATASKVYIDAVEYTRQTHSAARVESSYELSRIQYGTGLVTVGPGTYFGSIAVTLPRTFRSNYPPSVVATAQDANHYCAVTNIGAAGFTLFVVHTALTNENTQISASWIAVG